MSIKVNFEIGHEASVRTKRTPEGFTHDWEVFVRGVDNAEISQFVDKVVFQLHETFPKPRRPVKEPPYCVKESGYAGFNLPIEIYLKNPDEPKKIQFNYDLNLQQSGPPIIKVQKERHVFHHPAEDFRRKLLRGGGMVTSANPFLPAPSDHERSSRDSFTDDKPQPLIGKPKLGGDSKKSKTKDYETHRPLNHFENLFGTPIRISPDSKKPSPNPKQDKLLKEKEKEKHAEKEKTSKTSKHDAVKEHREDKQKAKAEKERIKDEKERLKEEKRSSKSGKDRDQSKEKSSKRSAERPPSPAPNPKRPAAAPVSSAPKVNPPSTPKDEAKPSKHESETKSKAHSKPSEPQPAKGDKKAKKEKRSHDKEREGKKEHKKEKESKVSNVESREVKPKDVPKEAPVKEVATVKEKEKPPAKPGKISIRDMLKDPVEPAKQEAKHKDKGDRERKHKHKKKDKKRDGSREKNKESSSKDKKHKHDKSSSKSKVAAEAKEQEKPEPVREVEKLNSVTKAFKEKDRSLLTISPISVDTSSQSSSKSATKNKAVSNPLSSMMNELSSGSNSDSNASMPSDDENNSMHSENNSRSNLSKASVKQTVVEPPKVEPQKVVAAPETTKPDKGSEKSSQGSAHKKSKEKISKHDTKEEKKRKRDNNSKIDESESSKKVAKVAEEPEHPVKPSKRLDSSMTVENVKEKSKIDSPRIKTDTKVQDDGVSSSLSDHPSNEEVTQTVDRKQMTADYMAQLKELQHKIMTIKSNDLLETVVNLIAETGKFEVTKKTFDFDLCLLDKTTVQQLQEMIGCETRA